jgi:hypothetical protein
MIVLKLLSEQETFLGVRSVNGPIRLFLKRIVLGLEWLTPSASSWQRVM